MSQTKRTKEDLALKIAKSFNEEKDVKLYLYMTKHYKETAINKAYENTMKVPDEKIKKTRSALFFFLVKKYDKEKE
ncbi:MAG: hypothetical protein ACT6FE_03750 [Methanosarcinaceae archaeon]